MSRYELHPEWLAYAAVISADMSRMPHKEPCSVRILCAYAYLNRGDGYWQGFLYLLYPLLAVFPAARCVSAFGAMLCRVRHLGPHGQLLSMHMPCMRLQRVALARSSVLHAPCGRSVSWLLDEHYVDMVCCRWYFIYFGQVFPASLWLEVWDTLLVLCVPLPVLGSAIMRLYCSVCPPAETVREDLGQLFSFVLTHAQGIAILACI